MHVGVIRTISGFEAVKAAWDEVHARDPESSIFSSWDWFHGWLSATPHPWEILSLESPGGGYVAFFPLSRRQRVRRGIRIGEFLLGGNPSSDHAGFVCLPEHREAAAGALAAALRRRREWSVLALGDVFDGKLDQLAEAFPAHFFAVRSMRGQPCPYLLLPESWDGYLAAVPRHESRKKFRRYMREFAAGGEFRVELAGQDTFAPLLETFMVLFSRRWPQVPQASRDLKRRLLQSCFAADGLLLAVLYYRDRPIAAEAAYTDRKNATLSFYNGGWDRDFAKLRPGHRLTCYLIHHALTAGFRCVDFLRGGEAYKQECFGATLRYNRDILVLRRDLKWCWERGLDLAGSLAGRGRELTGDTATAGGRVPARGRTS